MTEPEPTQENPSADAGQLHQTFKCGGCAAKMEFKPGANAQECPFCGHENPIPKSEDDIKELDLRALEATRLDGTSSFSSHRLATKIWPTNSQTNVNKIPNVVWSRSVDT